MKRRWQKQNGSAYMNLEGACRKNKHRCSYSTELLAIVLRKKYAMLEKILKNIYIGKVVV